MNNNINNKNNNQTIQTAVPSTPAVQATPTAVPATPTVQATPTAVPATPAVQATPTAVPATPTVQATPTAVPATPTVQATPTAVPATPAVQATATAVPATPAVQATATAVPATPAVQATPTAVPATPNVQATPDAFLTQNPNEMTNITVEAPPEPIATATTTNNNAEKKDKNILQYVPIILLILVLVLGGFVGGPKIISLVSKNKNENEITENNDSSNTNKNEQTNTNTNNNENTTTNNENTNNNQNNEQLENNTNQTCTNPTTWNGVYTNGENYITLYQSKETEIIYSVKIDSNFITGIADEITGNKASGEIFETHTFELCNNTLTFTTTDKDLQTITFIKTKDYTKNDFFTDTYGDPALLNTEINGIFKKGTTTLKLFQTSATEASVTIIDNNSYFGKILNLTGNTLSYEDDFLDEIQKINITITGNTLTLISSSSEQDSYLNSYSGTYTKESSYTMEQIIEDN